MSRRWEAFYDGQSMYFVSAHGSWRIWLASNAPKDGNPSFAKIYLSTGKCQKTIAKTKKTKKTKKNKKKLEIWPGGARGARLISPIFLVFLVFFVFPMVF